MPESNLSGLGSAPDEPFSSSSSGSPEILGTNQLQVAIDKFDQAVNKLADLYSKARSSADASGLPGAGGGISASANAGGPSFPKTSAAPGSGIYSAAQAQPGQAASKTPGLNMWSSGGNGQGFINQFSFGGGSPGVTIPGGGGGSGGGGGLPAPGGGSAGWSSFSNAFASGGTSQLGTQVAFSNYLQAAYRLNAGQPGNGTNNQMLAQAVGRPGAWNTGAQSSADALAGTALMQQQAGSAALTGPGSSQYGRSMYGAAAATSYLTGSDWSQSSQLSSWLYQPMTSYRMMMMGFPQPTQPGGQGQTLGLQSVLFGINQRNFGRGTIDPKTASQFFSTRGVGYQELLQLTGGNTDMANQLASTDIGINQAVSVSKKRTGKQLDWNQVYGMLQGANTGNKGDRSTLDKLGITETEQRRLQDHAATQTGTQAELFNSFQSGLTAATAAANSFANVLQKILSLPGVNQLAGMSAGMTSISGPLSNAAHMLTHPGSAVSSITGGLSSFAHMLGVPGGGSSGSGNKSGVTNTSGAASKQPKSAGKGVTSQAKAAAADAQSQLGVPYVWGGETPGKGFDCSGLTQWSYQQAGVSLPRTSQSQWSFLSSRRRAVDLRKVQEGDLIFKAGSDGTGNAPGHVAMMISNNSYVEAEMCVPADNTEILVRRGWVRFDEIMEGDETLGFDHDSKTLQWTPINGVAVYPDSEVVTMGTKRWKAECTPNHKWVTKKKKNNKWLSSTELTPLNLTCSSHQILLSAPADTKEVLPISDVDAEILGWIIGDGTIRARSESWVEATIIQAKSDGVARIRELLVNVPHTESVRYPKRSKPCLPQSIFYLHAVYAHALLDTIGYHDKLADLSSVILAMSPSQRAAFMRGIDGAEGEHTRKNSTLTVSQNNGPVQDAIVLCMYLLGYRPTRQAEHLGDMSNVPNRTITATIPRLHIVPGQFSIVPSRRTQTWCPLTGLGSWTMRQNGNVCVTGNTGVPIHDRPYNPREWQHAARPTGNTAGSSPGGVPGSGSGSKPGSKPGSGNAAGGPDITGMGSGGGSPSSTSEAENVAAGLAGGSLGAPGGTGSAPGSGGNTTPAGGGSSKGGKHTGGNVPLTGGGTPAKNRALGQKIAAAKFGWVGGQWAALDKLWGTYESGWNNNAQNPGSTAYGIAQFLDTTWAPYGKKTSKPGLQELYGMEYIRDRYKDPVHALAFELSHTPHWYSGGTNSAKAGAAVLGERGPEIALLSGGQKIFDAKQTQEMLQAVKRPAQTLWKTAPGGTGTAGGGNPVTLQFAPGSIVIGSSGDNSGTRWATANSAREFVRKVKKILEEEELNCAIATGQKAS